MQKETYKDGKLIESVEINSIPYTPEWAIFNRAMLIDVGYNRIAVSTTNQRAVNLLENIVSPAGYVGRVDERDYTSIKATWDSIISGLPLPSKPTAAEIAAWNAIASATFMQFKFDSDGKMLLS